MKDTLFLADIHSAATAVLGLSRWACVQSKIPASRDPGGLQQVGEDVTEGPSARDRMRRFRERMKEDPLLHKSYLEKQAAYARRYRAKKK